MMRRRLFILGLFVLGLTLTINIVYGCIYTITTKHFKICLKYCEIGYFKCVRSVKLLARELEQIYDFYVNKLHLKMLRSCTGYRYIVYYSGLPLTEAWEECAYIQPGYLDDHECVSYIYFAMTDISVVAHELAHAVNWYYYRNIPSWIDESLANALAALYPNGSWRDIYLNPSLPILQYIQQSRWLPGVPYDYWPFFSYLLTHYNITKLYEKHLLTNMSFLKQNWLPFLKSILIFYPWANKIATYRINLTKNMIKINNAIISPWFSPTIITITSKKSMCIKVETSCKDVQIYPNTSLYVSPNTPISVIVYTDKKHFDICNINIYETKCTSSTYVEINGTLIPIDKACNITNIVGFRKKIISVKAEKEGQNIIYMTEYKYIPITKLVCVKIRTKKNIVKKKKMIEMKKEEVLRKIIGLIILLVLFLTTN